MDMKDLPFVHLLLFSCKQCNRPLAFPMASEEGNLEGIDGGIFDVKCECGWSQKMIGLEASRHWVASWYGPRGNTFGRAEECSSAPS